MSQDNSVSSPDFDALQIEAMPNISWKVNFNKLQITKYMYSAHPGI